MFFNSIVEGITGNDVANGRYRSKRIKNFENVITSKLFTDKSYMYICFCKQITYVKLLVT